MTFRRGVVTICPYSHWSAIIDLIGTITDRSAWVQQVPKIELHLHLEGAVRPGTMRELSYGRRGWQGDLDDGWEHSYYTFTDFDGFSEQFAPRIPRLPSEYARVAAECFEDLAAQRVIYAEVSFGLRPADATDEHCFWSIVEALEHERRAAEARRPMRVNYLFGLQRGQPVTTALLQVELVAQARGRGIGIVGIDLHGDERHYPPAPFAPAFRRAAELGLGIRAHAGEAAGPESVWDAIDLLGVRRIAHGVRSVEDPRLVERLRQGDVTLDLCPTSNVRTAAVPDLAAHPMRCLHELGIPVTISSDDPLPFFTTVEREYRLLVDELGMSRDDIRRITLNAVNAAFLPASDRATLAALVNGAYSLAERMAAR